MILKLTDPQHSLERDPNRIPEVVHQRLPKGLVTLADCEERHGHPFQLFTNYGYCCMKCEPERVHTLRMQFQEHDEHETRMAVYLASLQQNRPDHFPG